MPCQCPAFRSASPASPPPPHPLQLLLMLWCIPRKYARMAHLDLETWRKTEKQAYGSEVIDPGGT
jgi:hypothetical protein